MHSNRATAARLGKLSVKKTLIQQSNSLIWNEYEIIMSLCYDRLGVVKHHMYGKQILIKQTGRLAFTSYCPRRYFWRNFWTDRMQVTHRWRGKRRWRWGTCRCCTWWRWWRNTQTDCPTGKTDSPPSSSACPNPAAVYIQQHLTYLVAIQHQQHGSYGIGPNGCDLVKQQISSANSFWKVTWKCNECIKMK